MGLNSLRLSDYSDRELLLMMLDNTTDEDQSVSTYTMAKALDVQSDRKHQSVGARLAFLARHKLVERVGSGPGGSRWLVTGLGSRLAHGNLNKRDAATLMEMDPAQLIMATRIISRRASGRGMDAAKWMATREWKRNTTA